MIVDLASMYCSQFNKDFHIAHPFQHARVCHVHRGIRGGIKRHYHKYRAHCQPKTRGGSPRTPRRLSMPPTRRQKATRSPEPPSSHNRIFQHNSTRSDSYTH
eukprot:COSAG05_NODE_686_length_7932_cov_3.338823_10_plen_102_part_00